MPVIGATWPGFVPHETCGSDVGQVDGHLAVEGRTVVGRIRPPPLDRRVEVGGCARPSLEVGERGVVGRDHAGPAARLDRHVGDRHPSLHREARGSPSPEYSITWPAAPSVPIWPIVPRIMSLAVHPGPSSPAYVDAHACGAGVAGASASRARARPRSSRSRRPARRRRRGRGVGVAAHDRHARLRDAELRPDHVDDALAAVSRARRAARRTPRSCGRARRAARARARRPRPARVGTLWSAVASVRSGRRTRRPASRSPSNACALVTSWTRCRSTYRSSSPTSWSAQTLSSIVRGAVAIAGFYGWAGFASAGAA